MNKPLNLKDSFDLDNSAIGVFPRGVNKLPYVILIYENENENEQYRLPLEFNSLLKRACTYWNTLLHQEIFVVESEVLKAYSFILLEAEYNLYTKQVGATSLIVLAADGSNLQEVVSTTIMINTARFNELSFEDQLGALKHELGHAIGLKHAKNGLMKKSFKPGKNNWDLDAASESMLRQALTLKRED